MKSVWHGRLAIKVAEAERAHTEHMVGGGAKNLEEYRYLVGFIAGMREAMRLAAELDNHMLGIPDGKPGSAYENH